MVMNTLNEKRLRFLNDWEPVPQLNGCGRQCAQLASEAFDVDHGRAQKETLPVLQTVNSRFWHQWLMDWATLISVIVVSYPRRPLTITFRQFWASLMLELGEKQWR